MHEKLKQEILRIVDDHSGGLKHLELLQHLINNKHVETVKEFYQIIESIPVEIPELGVLEYYADLGDDIKRVKHFIYRKPSSEKKIVRKGFVQAMDGTELWINTETDEMIKFVVKDHDLRWRVYCRPVTVTFEFGEKEK